MVAAAVSRPDPLISTGDPNRCLHEVDPTHDTASNPMNLLFIVRSGKSSNKTEDDRRQINRRAQQNAFLKKQQARQRKVSLVKSAQFEPHREETTGEASNNITKTHLSLVKNSEHSDDVHSTSLQTLFDTRRLDPFSSGKSPMTPHMESIFFHFSNVLLPVIEPIQAERDEFHQWLVPMTMTEPALLYALTACFAYDIEMGSAYGFGPTARKTWTTERVLYRIKAIQALNECLADPESAMKPSTLLAVHYLLWHEIFAGDECVHLDGVVRLLQLRGGFKGVQRKAIEGVMVGSFWRAIRTRSRPVIPRIADDLDLSTDLFQSVLRSCDASTARMGEAFFDDAIRGVLSESMLKLFDDARITWICFERVGIHDFTIDEKRTASMKRADIDQRFASYPFDHFDSFRPIQEVCRQAFIIYSNAHYNVVQPASKVGRCLVEDLKRALEATDLRGCWGDAWPALLWALFFGAHMSCGQRERPWFVAALARVARKGSFRDWLHVRAVLVRFYYVDRVLQEEFRKIWDEADLLRSLLLEP